MSEKIRPGYTHAYCWDVKQPTNNTGTPSGYLPRRVLESTLGQADPTQVHCDFGETASLINFKISVGSVYNFRSRSVHDTYVSRYWRIKKTARNVVNREVRSQSSATLTEIKLSASYPVELSQGNSNRFEVSGITPTAEMDEL